MTEVICVAWNSNLFKVAVPSAYFSTLGVLSAKSVKNACLIPQYESDIVELEKQLDHMTDSLYMDYDDDEKYGQQLRSARAGYTLMSNKELYGKNKTIKSYLAEWKNSIPEIDRDIEAKNYSVSHHWEEFVNDTAKMMRTEAIPFCKERFTGLKIGLASMNIGIVSLGAVAPFVISVMAN